MKHSMRCWVVLAAGLMGMCAAAAQPPDWQVVVPAADPTLTNEAGELIGDDGQPLKDSSGVPLMPKCALPEITVGGQPVPNPFRFFVQAGDPRKLIVYHTGGGACWNGFTCASSLGGASGTYFPAILDTPETLRYVGGILQADAPDNPFADWTKVYIPYCTGDIGWGNRDTNYLVPFPFQIAHRGYANVRAVTTWLRRAFEAQGQPSKVIVAGASAGGYAAVGTVLAEVAKVSGSDADLFVIGDSANGIVTDGFLQAARAAWGFDATVPGYILSAVDQGAAGLPARVYSSAARTYRGARFGQVQNAFDLVQAQVFNIMKYPDSPALWQDPTALGAALLEWTAAMRLNTVSTAVIPTYRFYTAAGFEHTVLQWVPPDAGLGFCSDDFYGEASARSLTGTVALRDWANDMVFRSSVLWRSGQWKNATCAPYCNVPPVCPVP
jgi:hypothetical protein